MLLKDAVQALDDTLKPYQESIKHTLLHCFVHERRKAALCVAILQLSANSRIALASFCALSDDEGVVAFLREGFDGRFRGGTYRCGYIFACGHYFATLW